MFTFMSADASKFTRNTLISVDRGLLKMLRSWIFFYLHFSAFSKLPIRNL